MARPAPWQLSLDVYPFTIELQTRYSDLDVMGHVNNVAIAGLFETARISMHHRLCAHPREHGVRWLVAAVNLNYMAEMHFPAPVTIGCGFHALGNSSWTILSAAFQDGECTATCETVIVTHGPDGRRRIPDAVRADMQPWLIKAFAEAGAS